MSANEFRTNYYIYAHFTLTYVHINSSVTSDVLSGGVSF